MQNELKELTGGAVCQTVNNPLQPKEPDKENGDVKNLTPHTSCPNCHVPWDSQEIDFQACSNCGYPLHQLQNRLNYPYYNFTEGYYLH